ncbi:hypothetical protein [Spirosoma fluminis]
MKKYLLLWLLTLIGLSGPAQNLKIQKAKRVYLGTLQKGRATRNMDLYPDNSLGKAAFFDALNAGCISITLNTGVEIVANCSSSTAVSNMLSARYTYSPGVQSLDVEAAPAGGSALTMKVERVDGVPLAMQSSGNQQLTSGTYYIPGPLSNQGSYTQEWSFRKTDAAGSGIPATPIRLTWKRTSDSQTFSHVFTPTSATRQQIVQVSGNTDPPISGTTGQPPSYTGTQSLNFAAYSDQGWPQSVGMKYIENDQIKVGFIRGGAVIGYAALKNGPHAGRNLVNNFQIYWEDDPSDYRYKTITPDLGRQIMFGSDYGTPGPEPNGYTQNGKNTKQGYKGHVFNTGYNVVQGGSLFPALDESLILKSAVINDSRGQVFCGQIRARIWGLKGESGNIVLDQEVWLNGTAICYKVRHNVEPRPGNADQPLYYAIEQENPCMYILAPFTTHYTKLGGQLVNRYPGGNPSAGPQFSNTVYSDECWVGGYEGPNGIGLTWYSPMNSAIRTGQMTGTVGAWNDNATSYINSAYRFNYDNPGAYDDYGYIILGSNVEALTKIAQLPGIDQSFDFDFTQDNHRWWNLNSRMIKGSGNWSVYIGELNQDGGTFGEFQSPPRAWQAGGIQTIQFDMAVENCSGLWLEWRKPGDVNDNNLRFKKFLPLQGDGVRRTYTISTSDPNFSGIISQIGLKAIMSAEANGNPVTPTNAKLTVYRIRKI